MFSFSSRSPLEAAFCAGAVMAVAGCGPPDSCWPASQDVACAQPTGTAAIAVPDGLDAATSVSLWGFNCLSAVNGSCSDPPRLSIDALFGATMEWRLTLDVLVPPGEGAATYDLPQPTGSAVLVGGRYKLGSAGVPDDWVPLWPVSGAVVVEQSTPESFRASFEMELETPDHLVFSVSNGSFELRGCQVVRVAAGCVAGN